jgi:hypothetical protein
MSKFVMILLVVPLVLNMKINPMNATRSVAPMIPKDKLQNSLFYKKLLPCPDPLFGCN